MNDKELKEKILKYLFKKNDKKFIELLVSGRSAIDFAIKDMVTKRKISKAILPDYICESMIEPFVKNGIEIEFYPVKFENNEFFVDYSYLYGKKDCCILICDYYIPNEKIYTNITNAAGSENCIIHDITHTFLSRDLNVSKDDYTICSLRKWFDVIDGGFVISNRSFEIKRQEEHTKYIENKKKSRKLKQEYYKNPTKENKKIYKFYYNLAEEILNNDFGNYSVSQETIDKITEADFYKSSQEKQKLFQKIYNILIENNIEFLKNIEKYNCLFTIPIIVNNRDEVLEEFYDNLIRCAVFWEYNEYNKDRPNNFVDNGICLSISENTNKQLKRIMSKKRGNL